MWRVGARGADSVMFRSDDHGESFHTVERGAGVHRGMVMRFRTVPGGDGDFFGVSDDGTVTARLPTARIRAGYDRREAAPAYDLVIVP